MFTLLFFISIWIWINVIRDVFHTARAPWRLRLETISTLKSARSPEIPKATSCSWDLQKLRRLLRPIIRNSSVDQTCRRCCYAFLWALRHKKKGHVSHRCREKKGYGVIKSKGDRHSAGHVWAHPISWLSAFFFLFFLHWKTSRALISCINQKVMHELHQPVQ